MKEDPADSPVICRIRVWTFFRGSFVVEYLVPVCVYEEYELSGNPRVLLNFFKEEYPLPSGVAYLSLE
jgi:hypothetical protein